jgi:hypothetical protein
MSSLPSVMIPMPLFFMVLLHRPISPNHVAIPRPLKRHLWGGSIFC